MAPRSLPALAAVLLAARASAAAAAATAPFPVLTAFGANSIRVQWAPPGMPVVNSSFSPFLDVPVSASAVTRTATTLTAGNLAISVDAATGFITATRVSDGVVLLTQTNITWGPAVARGRFPSAELAFKGRANDETLVGMGEQGLSNHVALERPFERVYVDTEYYAYNSGRQAFMPVYFSSKGYGVVVAQQGYGFLRVDVEPYSSAVNASSTQTVDMWITTTPGDAVYDAAHPHPFLSLLEQYADVVGHAPPMPAFAAGFIACKDRYRNQSQLLDVAHGYVDRGIPISMIVIDWFHWENLGDMSLKPACWPDPQGMVDELRSLGIELMTTHWPFMSQTSVHRAEYEAAGALAVNASSGVADTFWEYLQSGALITTLSEATRNLTIKNWQQGYGQYGIRAMWLDETEPDRTGPSNDGLITGNWRYEGVSDTELGPTWRQQWLRTMTDALRELYGVGNYFLLSRSAWLGTAKYGHAVWSGDTSSSWDNLALQIPTMLGAGLSGLGLWTSDLGGYSPTMQPFDPKLEELYVRWAQFAAVSPLMRLHGHRNGGPPDDKVCMQTNGDNEPWTLFQNQTNMDAMIAMIKWRDQRRNYVVDVQAAWAATNVPMCSPVWLHFPGDAVCAFDAAGDDGACAGAFMFGPDYLAKPVVQFGQTSAWVWLPQLPQGQAWVYEFGNRTNYGRGGINITIAAPIAEFPLFMRQSA